MYSPDTLTPEVAKDQSAFCFINHTYDHQNVDLTNYATSLTELQQNQQSASTLGLGCYSIQEFVQPDISGLTNTNFLQAAYDAGVRYLITDTSQPGWNNPSPNAGFSVGPGNGILAIPRHPSNLFYNLQTPAQWVDEYNWYYWTGSPSTSPWKFWSTPQTYQQILDHESDNADAETDGDLDAIATAARVLPGLVLAGSAGLARAWPSLSATWARRRRSRRAAPGSS